MAANERAFAEGRRRAGIELARLRAKAPDPYEKEPEVDHYRIGGLTRRLREGAEAMTAAQIGRALRREARQVPMPSARRQGSILGVVERDGRVLVRCYSGCAQSDVIDALRRDGVWPEVAEQPRERSWTVRRPDGKHVEHMRVDKPDGKRVWWKPALRPLKVCDLSLYAVDQVPRESHLVVITEGEPACDALLADGVPRSAR